MPNFANYSTNGKSSVYAALIIALVAFVLVTARQFVQTEGVVNEAKQVRRIFGQQINHSPYQNGTYEVMGEYMSPGGAEQIAVKLTLQNGQITEAEVQPQAERPNSVKFQGIFAQNYQAFVLGKNIDELQLDKVAGSSLTPKGFNDALEKIKQEARNS